MNNKNILVEKKKSKKKTVSSITYTTGDPDLNIKFFNRSMGTDFSKDISSESNSLDNDNGISSEVAGEGGALTEAKRETKRYYIRPQNIFCANKSDVLKALTEIDTENCSVYTLKNLEDHDDVHLLTNKDIIYYYDEEVLYDKNHVKIMDYKLSIKNEEERKNFSQDVEDVADSAFRAEYDDRLTDRTIDLQESFCQNCWGIDFLPEGRRSEYGSELIATNIFNKLKEIIKAEPHIYKPEYTVVLFKGLADDKTEEIDKFVVKDLLVDLLEPKAVTSEDTDMFFMSINSEIEEAEEVEDPLYEDDFDAVEYPDIRLDDDIFNQEFEARNVFGEAVEKTFTCCICGEESVGFGNNPAPYKEKGKCCDSCNIKFVIPARIDENQLD